MVGELVSQHPIYEPFLKQLEIMVPDVLDSLYEDLYLPFYINLFSTNTLDESIFVEYMKFKKIIKLNKVNKAQLLSSTAFKLIFSCRTTKNELYKWAVNNADESKLSSLLELKYALESWQSKYNLKCAWMQFHILITLDFWKENNVSFEQISGKGYFSRFYDYELDDLVEEDKSNTRMDLSAMAIQDHASDEEKQLIKNMPPDFPRWKPLEQTKKEYLDLIKQKAENCIKSSSVLSIQIAEGSKSIQKAFVDSILKSANIYCGIVENTYLKLKYRKLPKKHKEINQLRWTIEVQVLGKSFTEIAERDQIDVSNVNKRVNEILKSLGLTKRTNINSGRPKGKKDTIPRRRSS